MNLCREVFGDHGEPTRPIERHAHSGSIVKYLVLHKSLFYILLCVFSLSLSVKLNLNRDIFLCINLSQRLCIYLYIMYIHLNSATHVHKVSCRNYAGYKIQLLYIHLTFCSKVLKSVLCFFSASLINSTLLC